MTPQSTRHDGHQIVFLQAGRADSGQREREGCVQTGRALRGVASQPLAAQRCSVHSAASVSTCGAPRQNGHRRQGGGVEQEASDGPAAVGMHPDVYSRCGAATLVHPPAEPQFAHAGPGDSASFKATPRAAAAGGYARAGGASTPAIVGPGAYETAAAEAPARSTPRLDGVGWGSPRPVSAPARASVPQLRRHAVLPGPGAYDTEVAAHAGMRPQSRGCDFSRGTARPGSAPGRPSAARVSSAGAATRPTSVGPLRTNDLLGSSMQPETDRAGGAGAQSTVGVGGAGPARRSAGRKGGVDVVAVDGAEDETQDYIYDDDEEDDGGTDADELDWGASRNLGVLAAVEGARSAADVRVALQQVGGGRSGGRPTSARPPSGRPRSGRPTSGPAQRSGGSPSPGACTPDPY